MDRRIALPSLLDTLRGTRRGDGRLFVVVSIACHAGLAGLSLAFWLGVLP